MKFEKLQKKILNIYDQKCILDLGHKYLYDIVINNSQGIIVEIGVLSGLSATVLCSAAEEKNVKYYGIDPWDLLTSNDHLRHLIKDPVKNEKLARKAMLDLGFNNYEFIKGFSYNIVEKFDEPIGCLFIDGCHCYECVKKDFKLWAPKIVKGGLIVFHDAGWEGVGRVIESIVKKDSNFIEIQNVSIETYKKIS